MNSNREVFIETTSIIDYIFKTKYFVQIKNILDNYDKKTTAHYVKMEIKRGFLQYLVYLHGKVVRCESLGEVSEAINKLAATPQQHRYKTAWEAIEEYFKSIDKTKPSDIIKKYGDIPLSQSLKIDCEGYLRSIIRRLFRNVDRVVDEIVIPMKCFVDIESPRELGRLFDNTPSKCTGSQVECNIKQFFRDNEEAFTKIRDKLDSKSKKEKIDNETQQRISSLHKIFRLLPLNNRKFSNKEPEKVVQLCWRCGDAILAVTAPANADVLNHNRRHYDTLCDAIGKRSISY